MVKSEEGGAAEAGGAGGGSGGGGSGAADCHSETKSSADARKRKACCQHRAAAKTRWGGVSVACQTLGEGSSAEWPSSSSPALPLPEAAAESRSEGLLRLMIQNFRNMTDTVRGPGKMVSGVEWKIMVMPRQHVVAKKGTQKCLGFFLQCCPDSYSDSWSCQASAELRLISQNSSVSNFVRKTSHLYTAKENDWGYSCFMTWADILDEAQGYMKDEKVILEVYVKAESPKGILSHDAFCKKIEDYMRLADMQSSRGLIDKAIEVNQTAVRFCKDKDPDMKAELEAQKARLIEQKLKQSIERIEKGSTNGGPDDPADPTANLNTLRNALKADWQGLRSPAPPPPPANGPAKDAKAKAKPASPTTDKEDGMDVVNIAKGQPKDGDPDKDSTVREGSEDEASCSDDDDDHDPQDEEICDSCLQEKLEVISGEEEEAAEVETHEFSCQTDAPPPPPKKEERTEERWTSERENELFELITQESRASLDSIRDTLERLVSLAKDGEVPAGLETDLAVLKEEQREREMLNADFVEIPLPVEANATAPAAPPLPPPNAPKLRPAAAAADKLAALGDLSPAELHLVNKAKLMVQAKAEELMAKYSQLIQQSEATKLAETVKKVERRMKDIEKQTMTCRKELADECERHCREEAKLVKANRALKTQVDAATERAEKANAALKERKAEIKRMEKKLKGENQLAEANSDLEARISGLEKDVSEARHKASEAAKRLQREEGKWAEAKKAMGADLAAASQEVDRLAAQLEERKAQIKKLESRLDQERRSNSTSIRDALERAKKAEVNLLEFKLEMGLKLLERAVEDCQNNINHLDDIFRRSKNPQSEELKPVRAYMAEWERTRDKIGELMSKAKTDFGGAIEAVKGGKPLAGLAAVEVAKPPPPPQAPKMSPAQMKPQEAPQAPPAKAPPAPIGRPNPSGASSGAQPANGVLNNNPGEHPETPQPPRATPPAPLTPKQAVVSGSATPAFPPPHQQGMKTPPPNFHPAPSHGGPERSSSVSNGFSPWSSDPLSSLTESLFTGGRAMGGLGFGDSWASSGPNGPSAGLGLGPPGGVIGGGPPRPVGPPQQFTGPPPPIPPFNLSQPPPPLGPPQSSAGGGGGQWGVGWGYNSVTSAAPTPSNLQSPVAMLSRMTGGSPGVGGGGGDGERAKRAETLMESLAATFPSFSQDTLRDYVAEYRSYQSSQTLKGLSLEAAFNGVASLILSKNKNASWKSDGKGGLNLLSAPMAPPGAGSGASLDAFKYQPSPDEYPALT